MASELLVGALITLGGILVGILSAVLGWLVRRLWEVRGDVDEISQSYVGTDDEEGSLQRTRHGFERIESRLDDFENTLSYMERDRQESHERLCEKIDGVVLVLRDHGFNGNLPEVQDD